MVQGDQEQVQGQVPQRYPQPLPRRASGCQLSRCEAFRRRLRARHVESPLEGRKAVLAFGPSSRAKSRTSWSSVARCGATNFRRNGPSSSLRRGVRIGAHAQASAHRTKCATRTPRRTRSGIDCIFSRRRYSLSSVPRESWFYREMASRPWGPRLIEAGDIEYIMQVSQQLLNKSLCPFLRVLSFFRVVHMCTVPSAIY